MRIVRHIYELLVLGNQKAIIGAVLSGATVLIGLVGLNLDMTIREAVTVLTSMIVTGIGVYFKRNQN